MPGPRQTRDAYRHFQTMTSRWRDMDAYGHMNNAVYYEYVDTCVNVWLKTEGGLEVPGGPIIGLVVESGCVFHAPIAFADRVSCGLRVARIGKSSVTYEVGLFCNADAKAAAEARFVHVYVDAGTRRPQALPQVLRNSLEGIADQAV